MNKKRPNLIKQLILVLANPLGTMKEMKKKSNYLKENELKHDSNQSVCYDDIIRKFSTYNNIDDKSDYRITLDEISLNSLPVTNTTSNTFKSNVSKVSLSYKDLFKFKESGDGYNFDSEDCEDIVQIITKT